MGLVEGAANGVLDLNKAADSLQARHTVTVWSRTTAAPHAAHFVSSSMAALRALDSLTSGSSAASRLHILALTAAQPKVLEASHTAHTCTQSAARSS